MQGFLNPTTVLILLSCFRACSFESHHKGIFVTTKRFYSFESNKEKPVASLVIATMQEDYMLKQTFSK